MTDHYVLQATRPDLLEDLRAVPCAADWFASHPAPNGGYFTYLDEVLKPRLAWSHLFVLVDFGGELGELVSYDRLCSQACAGKLPPDFPTGMLQQGIARLNADHRLREHRKSGRPDRPKAVGLWGNKA